MVNMPQVICLTSIVAGRTVVLSLAQTWVPKTLYGVGDTLNES